MAFYEFGKDIKKLQDIFIERYDIYFDANTIKELWEDFSNERLNARWFGVPENKVDNWAIEECYEFFLMNKERYWGE